MVSKQKQVLLTGATGFIGGYVLREIAKRKLAVTAFYRSKKPNDLADQNVRWLQSDMADGFPQASLSKIPDVLIHLAWGGLPNYNSDFHMTEELPRQKRFLEEAIQFGIRNVFVVGTCFEYGKIDGLLKEDFRTHPHTSYGEAKDELRQYVQKLQKDEAFNFTWGRLFYLYGAGQGERSLYTQLQNAIASMDDLPAETDLSKTISKDLKARGFKFCGPTIVYAFMEAVGMVNDHLTPCFRHAQCAGMASSSPFGGS